MADITMVMVGDNYVQRKDPDTAFAPALPYLKDADIGFCNLETVVADAKYLSPHDHDTRPRTDEWIFPHYIKAGFNVYNIANNPSYYHGLACFSRGLEVLDAAGVVYGGGGRTIAEARKPAVIEKKGTKVAFVCRTSVCAVDAGATADRAGVARFRVSTAYEPRSRIQEVPGSPPIVHTFPDPEDRAALKEDIRTARSQADVVVVSWHWGVSPATGGAGELVDYQTEMAHFALDVGADMVVGHHPHVLQPIEIYKGKPVVYSLANWVHDMGSFREGRNLTTMLVRVTIRDKKIAGLAFVPGRIDGHGPPELFKPGDAPDIVKHMEQISAPFKTQFKVDADGVEVVL